MVRRQLYRTSFHSAKSIADLNVKIGNDNKILSAVTAWGIENYRDKLKLDQTQTGQTHTGQTQTGPMRSEKYKINIKLSMLTKEETMLELFSTGISGDSILHPKPSY